MSRRLRTGRALASAAAMTGSLLAVAAASPAAFAAAPAAHAAAPAAHAAAPAANAATPANPLLGQARLAGTFQLAGRITSVVRVKGERKGQNVLRQWSFLPDCQVGSCRTVALLRGRSNGSDKVKLTRRRAGYYTGSGSFYAPLKCGRTVFRRGQFVPFTVTVTVTGAVRDQTGAVVATRVNATYTNKTRRNLTKCVAFLGHDAATYHGHVLPGSSSGATGGTGGTGVGG